MDSAVKGAYVSKNFMAKYAEKKAKKAEKKNK